MNDERKPTDPTVDAPHFQADASEARALDPEVTGAEAGQDLAPMSFSLLGRFFAVPMLIIGSIVGGAVVVVVLFGGPAEPYERPLMELIQALEATTGESRLGILLPREKEHWQTALELSVRLKEKEKEPDLTDGQLSAVASRLAGMVRSESGIFDQVTAAQLKATDDLRNRSRRLEFMIRALGRTERPEAVEALIEIVRGGREPFVQVAMLELAELREMPGARQALKPMADLLNQGTSPETRLVACTVLSVIATPDDADVISALTRARLGVEGEVAWSAALALARLGSVAGKSTLLDLLDRSFLESDGLYQVTDDNGTVHRYALTPQRVEEILLAAVDAVSNLADPDLWETIEQLKSDSSPVVRARVEKILADHGRLVALPARTRLED